MSLSTLPAFAIVIRDNVTSEYYYNTIAPKWAENGIKIDRFDAITPETLPDGPLNFQPIKTAKYTSRGYKKQHSPTEKAIWYSHYALWHKCLEMRQRILILEHDAYPVHPERLIDHPDLDFVSIDMGAMGAYILSPKGARKLIDYMDNRGRVETGPLGFVDMCTKGPLKLSAVYRGAPVHGDKWKPAVKHAIHSQYGKTIDHYTGTEAEKDSHQFVDHPAVFHVLG